MSKTSKTLSILSAAILVAATAPAFAASVAQEFINKAAIANMFEIETSKLAQDRAMSPEVKKFANMMVKEHGKTGTQLKTLLAKDSNDGLVLPEALDEAHTNKLNALKEAVDGKFDSAYMKVQADAHDDVVDLFEDYAEDGTHADLKQFAKTTLPALEHHEDMADDLEDKVSKR